MNDAAPASDTLEGLSAAGESSPGERHAPTTTEPPRSYHDLYAEIAQLAGGLAHEVRNPLSTIRLNLDLLVEDFTTPETPRERRILQKLERVRTESHRLEAILENFLRFLRVKELVREPADLNAVIDDLRVFLEPLAAAQNVVIRTQLAADLPPVPLDIELFRQHVLYNLMRNAQLAMPEGGELILITRREGPKAVLEVIDTGCGIAPELLPEIFRPFFTSRTGGTGLGLPMARRVVDFHGGTLGVESTPGKGSKFTVRLPLRASGPAETGAA